LGVRFFRERIEPLPTSTAELEQDSTFVLNCPEVKDDKLDDKIDLNKAGQSDLVKIPGIGPVTANRIIVFREANGVFKSINELEKVKGIGKKTVLKISPFVIIK